MKRARPLLIFSIACLLTVLAGRWAQGLFIVSEFVHFSINFPTAPGHDTRTREQIGGPWAMLDDDEWEGVPAGGLIVWGREGEIVVDLGQQGVIKRTVQSHDVTLSTHWLRNVGTKPYAIGLAVDMCGLPVEWETFEVSWDEHKKVSTRVIDPGAFFNMDWHVTVPADQRDAKTICNGGVKVTDADTGELLTFFPISLINSAASKEQ